MRKCKQHIEYQQFNNTIELQSTKRELNTSIYDIKLLLIYKINFLN